MQIIELSTQTPYVHEILDPSNRQPGLVTPFVMYRMEL